jgi:nucleoside-diphosphate-sugar epimerase
MKILVIGGTRFFGKRLVHNLVGQGHQVTILTRGNTADDFGASVQRLKGDRTSAQQFKSLIKENYDSVVDQMCMTAADANASIEAFSGRIGQYVMTSTLSVYEPGAQLKESDWSAESYVMGEAGHPYQEGKRAAEHAFLSAPFPVARMRIPIVLGLDDYTRRLHLHVEHVVQGQPLSFPNVDAHFSYVRAEDAAGALQWMIESGQKDVFNIGAKDSWSNRELLAQIENVVGKKAVLTKDGTPSPFGIERDYYMDVSKAANAGFRAQGLALWLPELIEKIFYFMAKA